MATQSLTSVFTDMDVLRLFDFPAELVSKILLHAVLVRDTKRALRLRLVCKRLSQELPGVLLESQMLDVAYSVQGKDFRDWCIQKDHGAIKFWHIYLMYRIRQNKPLPHRYHHIRSVAQRVCDAIGADLGATINLLCWPALDALTCQNGAAMQLEKESPHPDLDLLCAAAWLNLLPMAENLLHKGLSPLSESILFSSPVYVAAMAGKAQILEMFQSYLPERETADASTTWLEWRGKVSPYAIYGAAKSGDLNVLRLAIYPVSRASKGSDFMGQKVGLLVPDTAPFDVLRKAQSYARNAEVYRYLESFFQESGGDLARYSSLGNLEMVKYLLDKGADVHGTSEPHGNPLTLACERCHEDVVNHLVERGADPNRGVVYQGYPLVAAARSGSLSILRTLLRYGGRLFDKKCGGLNVGVLAMLAALRIENAEMLRFLVASGANIRFGGDAMLRGALALGLDSMVEVIREEMVSDCVLLENGQDLELVMAKCRLRPVLELRRVKYCREDSR